LTSTARPQGVWPGAEMRVRRGDGAPYIPGVLERIGYDAEMAAWVASADARLGRVVRVDRGLVSVLTEAGPLRTGVGAALLGRMAQDPLEGPTTGDWCVLRVWPDHRTTLE